MKTPKNIEIQNFEPQKVTRAYLCMKISEYTPSPLLHSEMIAKLTRVLSRSTVKSCVNRPL